MAFEDGVVIPETNADGQLVVSQDLVIANQVFFIEGFKGSCAVNSEEYSDVLKIQLNSADIASGICGLKFTTKNHEFGDYARLEIVDVDNLLGYGAGLVLGNFGQRFYLPHDGTFDILLDYKKVVPAGIYYRVRYTAVNVGSDRQYTCNLYLVR